MGTTGAARPIRAMRNVYGPSIPSALRLGGFLDRRVASDDGVAAGVCWGETGCPSAGAVIVGAGAGIDPSPVTSSPELQATMTAKRASPAMNRADPRGARRTGRTISGLMQEAAALGHGNSGRCSSSDQQADEASC